MSKICCVLGCDRAAKPHYTRCEDCIRVLVEHSSTLPRPERDPEVVRFERFRDRVAS